MARFDDIDERDTLPEQLRPAAPFEGLTIERKRELWQSLATMPMASPEAKRFSRKLEGSDA